MKTKFFRKNNEKQGTESGVKSLSPFSFLRSPRIAHLSCLLVLLTATFCAVAQNGVTLSGLVMDAGTVTFNVSWDKNDPTMPAIWSDTVWVWVDYNTAGTMTRLPLAPGATLTATSAPGVAEVMEVSGNNSGVWVLGNARSASAGSFSATVKLLTATATATGACVYASNYPPVGQYTAVDKIKFTGTPSFELTFNEGDGATVTRDAAKGTYTIPANRTLGSFTDKTGAPGVIKCAASSVYDLKASATDFCTGATVTFALSNTTFGRTYQLYKGSSVVNTLTGTGGATTFTGAFAGAGVYTAQVAATGGYCSAAMTGTHTISEKSLPAAPTMGGGGSQCGGSRTITASPGSGGTGIRWTDNNSTSQSRSVTATGTYYAVTMSTSCGESGSAGVSVSITPTPAQPTLTHDGPKALGGTLTFTASGCVGACNWGGNFSGSGSTKSATAVGTYTAQVRSNDTGCYSEWVSQTSYILNTPYYVCRSTDFSDHPFLQLTIAEVETTCRLYDCTDVILAIGTGPYYDCGAPTCCNVGQTTTDVDFCANSACSAMRAGYACTGTLRFRLRFCQY